MLNKENLDIVFNLIDTNNDGKISIQELMTMFATGQGASNLQKHHQENQKLLRDIMAEVDKDHDNFISHAEFNAAMTTQLRSHFS